MRRVHPQLSSVPFGGKVIVLGGDFRQMLPVIQRGSRSMIVNACINQSLLWRHFKVFHLSQNIRVDVEEEEWKKFLLQVGEGRNGDAVSILDSAHHATSVSGMIQRSMVT